MEDTPYIAKLPGLARVLLEGQRVGPSNSCVLIVGQYFSGRAQLAREIHRHSQRREFVETRSFDAMNLLVDWDRQASLATYFFKSDGEPPADLIRAAPQWQANTQARLIVAVDENSHFSALRECFEVVIDVPPLRLRLGDVEPLARHYLEKVCSGLGKRVTFTPEVFASLQDRTVFPHIVWPEVLPAVIERAVCLSADGAVLDFEAFCRPDPSGSSLLG